MAFSWAYPVEFTDGSGETIVIKERPDRIVSLVPGITELIVALGADEILRGITYHDDGSPQTDHKTVVGGFFAPSVGKIERCRPDVIFLSDIHRPVRDYFEASPTLLIHLKTPNTIEEIYENIRLTGEIVNRKREAEQLVLENKRELEITAKKIARIPGEKRKRVIRIMGRDNIMTPGSDSFQNAYISAAGGIPPDFGKKGSVVSVTKEEWMQFNPQVIYGCGEDREVAERFFQLPGWKDVDAVRQGRMYYFPCELTCRASGRFGHFVSWLAGTIYAEEFTDPSHCVLPEETGESEPLDLDLSYIKRAYLEHSTIYDCRHKTLSLEFTEPMEVLSTLEGPRSAITFIGNHYTPPSIWGVTHLLGLEASRKHFYGVLGKTEETSSFLFTGADMKNLSVQKVSYRDLTVYALVTAGVESNALRASEDEGLFYEPGTINMIIMTNCELTSPAMARSVISATEAKTAALQDLDIRSRSQPKIHQATGTGTDNIIVVSGKGTRIDNTGGHSKMGELIAKAVYDAVIDAIEKQNGIIQGRSIFQRLQERDLNPYAILAMIDPSENPAKLLTPFEDLLTEPYISSFLEGALALSDAYEKGQVGSLDSYELWCNQIAEKIAGKEMRHPKRWMTHARIPVVMRMAFDALINGLHFRISGSAEEGIYENTDVSDPDDWNCIRSTDACVGR